MINLNEVFQQSHLLCHEQLLSKISIYDNMLVLFLQNENSSSFK